MARVAKVEKEEKVENVERSEQALYPLPYKAKIYEKLRIRREKRHNRFYAVTPFFTADTQLFVDFYQVITAKDICFLFAIAFVVLYAFFRLLAVKAETSWVGHLSPSARGLTTVKTLLIFQDMCAPRIKMELFRCPKCPDFLLSNTCRSIFLIG